MSIQSDRPRKPYQAPEFEAHSLVAIVHAGVTGGGDSGQTGFTDFSADEDEDESGPFGGRSGSYDDNGDI